MFRVCKNALSFSPDFLRVLLIGMSVYGVYSPTASSYSSHKISPTFWINEHEFVCVQSAFIWLTLYRKNNKNKEEGKKNIERTKKHAKKKKINGIYRIRILKGNT